jgi:hypothetical protein
MWDEKVKGKVETYTALRDTGSEVDGRCGGGSGRGGGRSGHGSGGEDGQGSVDTELHDVRYCVCLLLFGYRKRVSKKSL